MTKPNTIHIDNVEYVRKDSIQPVAGKRAVVVVDRGWIVAGDVTEENGRIKLSRAVHVFKWSEIGFTGVIENPSDARVDLRPLANGFDIPAGSEIFRVPVADDWGL